VQEGEVTMSSIRAFDRAQDAYRLAKKKAVQTKVIVFVNTKPKIGVFPLEIRFPYKGKIIDLNATCGKVGAERTAIILEKCSKSDYITNPVWTVIANDIFIDSNERTTLTSNTPYAVLNSVVNEDDHFRLSFPEVGTGVANLSLEIIVEI
jgi:hypothetical protein